MAAETSTALKSQGAAVGRLVIGANDSFSVTRLPSMLRRFRKAYPDIDISLRFGTVRGIHELTQSNVADVAFS